MEMSGKLAWQVTPEHVFGFGELETSPDVTCSFINL
jgi:hypothetical protein